METKEYNKAETYKVFCDNFDVPSVYKITSSKHLDFKYYEDRVICKVDIPNNKETHFHRINILKDLARLMYKCNGQKDFVLNVVTTDFCDLSETIHMEFVFIDWLWRKDIMLNSGYMEYKMDFGFEGRHETDLPYIYGERITQGRRAK